MPISVPSLGDLRDYTDLQAGIREEFIQPVLGGYRTVAVLSSPLGQARPFGWVICHSYGIEHVHLGRLDVLAARALAAAGFPVLRFHSQGYGDSEAPMDGVGLSSHLAAATDAVALLRHHSEVDNVGVLGTRFGGLVAGLVADASDLPAVILYEPVTSGAQFARDLLRKRAISEMVRKDAQGTSRVAELRRELHARGWVDINGFPLSREAHDELTATELARDMRRFRGQFLLIGISRTGRVGPRLAALSEHLQGLGAGGSLQVLQNRYAGEFGQFHYRMDPKTRTKKDTLYPIIQDLSARTVEWCRTTLEPAQPGGAAPGTGRVRERISTSIGRDGLKEYPIFIPFGDDHLAAVVTAPDDQPKGLVVLLTGVGAPRTHRFQMWTRLARRLADHGLGSIRLDYDGMGDSTGEALDWTADWEDRLYPQVVAATRTAMEALNVDRVATVGNCGGARLALHLAGDLDQGVGALCLLLTVLDENTLTGVQLRLRRWRIARMVKTAPVLGRVVKRLRGRKPAWRVKKFLPGYFANALSHGRVLAFYGGLDREYSPRVHVALDRITATVPEEHRGRLDVHVVPGIQLGGFESRRGQDLVIDAAERWLISVFGLSSQPDELLTTSAEVARG